MCVCKRTCIRVYIPYAQANVAISTLAARVGKQKTVAEQRLRALRKKQEGLLNELASNLPVWKLYGWSGMFITIHVMMCPSFGCLKGWLAAPRRRY